MYAFIERNIHQLMNRTLILAGAKKCGGLFIVAEFDSLFLDRKSVV